MRLNIFGVGRSGTKALLIQILNMYSEKIEGFCYEPFLFKYSNGELNYYAIYKLINNDHLHISTSEVNRAKKIIKEIGIKDNKNDYVYVNKFIRACGYIKAFDNEFDRNIIVIRKLNGVLTSVMRQNWKLFGFGDGIFPLVNKSFLKSVVNKIQDSDLNYLLDDIDLSDYNDRIGRNALYWYLINMFLLEAEVDKLIIPYELKSEEKGELITNYLNVLPKSIDNFSGSNILLGRKNKNYSFKEFINEIMYFSRLKPIKDNVNYIKPKIVLSKKNDKFESKDYELEIKKSERLTKLQRKVTNSMKNYE